MVKKYIKKKQFRMFSKTLKQLLKKHLVCITAYVYIHFSQKAFKIANFFFYYFNNNMQKINCSQIVLKFSFFSIRFSR